MRHIHYAFHISLFIIFNTFFCHSYPEKQRKQQVDVNIVGALKFANGLGRVTTSFIDMFSKNFNVKFVDTRPHFTSLEDLPASVTKVALHKKRRTSDHISILTDNLWSPEITPSRKMPQSRIRLAVSMCESTRIPGPWVGILNKHFDAVLVPDDFFIEVYKASGVRIPIFVLPLAVYLDDFLKAPLKTEPGTPFTFGVSAALSRNKNVGMLIDAFAAEYGNNPRYVLKIHSMWQGTSNELRKKIEKLKLNNVQLLIGELPWEKYVRFMRNIDCYVLLSKGEGFSITPREALALGLPCILSDNTAHKTICKTGLVYAVPCPLVQPSEKEFYRVDVGNNFNCLIKDVRKALRTVAENYSHYLEKAGERRKWATHYTFDALRERYHTLLRPKKVLKGSRNEITSSYLMTTSDALIEKYNRKARRAT